MDFNYGDSLTQILPNINYIREENIKLQEASPEEFKEFIQVGKQLEKLASDASIESMEQFYKILSESPYQRNLTFSVFRSFQKAIFNKSQDWVKFFIETIGVNLTETNFRQLVHAFMVKSCQRERDLYLQGEYYEELDKDLKFLEILLLQNKYREFLLQEQDVSYGNTPLHVACGLHSFAFTRLLIDAGSDVTIKNLAGFTPGEIIDDEIKAYKIHCESKEKERTLERLEIIRNTFFNQAN